MRQGGEQLGGGTDHPDARLGHQPRGGPTDERVELGLEIVGLGLEGERALGGAAQPDDGGAMLDRLGGVAAQASAPGQQLVGRQRAQLLAQALGALMTSALRWLIAYVRAPHGAVAGGQQHANSFPVATPAWLGQVVTAERLAGRSNSVQVIGLGRCGAPGGQDGRSRRPIRPARTGRR